jgi:dTDP-6-deoxy-L-talose 4-dehydrogenase (NAD+)
MRILILGNGFISRELSEYLDQEEHEVLLVGRKQNSQISSPQVTYNLFEDEYFELFELWNPQIVISTAWVTEPKIYASSLLNYEYVKMMSRLAKRLLVSNVERLIILGSCDEYGAVKMPTVSGITPLNPESVYGQAKVSALREVESLLRDSDVKFTWARIFFPYGRSLHHEKFISQVFDSIILQQEFSIRSPRMLRDWISTRDISRAISWTINHNLIGEIDIATSIGVSNLDIVSILEALLSKKAMIKYEGLNIYSPSEDLMLVADSTSPIFTSGWLPEHNIVSGITWAFEL